MKILYCVRVFTGLASSLAAGVWKPTGVPTIYRMIEALDRGPDEAAFVLTWKDGEGEDVVMRLPPLTRPVKVLGGQGSTIRRDLRHAWQVWRMMRREQPDVLYFDNANIFVAAIISLLTHRSIVLRIMGVYPVMRRMLDDRGPRAALVRWCYRRPWSLAVCTQDGSGIEPWLERALRPGVPRIVLLNGLDRLAASAPPPAVAAIPPDRTVVMFLGKLEPEKGAMEFTEGFLAAHSEAQGLHALIVGAGRLSDAVRRRFSEAGASDALTQIDRLPHGEVAAALGRADIYVSLNRLGNLSNANLEAMLAGKAMVIPVSQPDTGVDTATDTLVPADALRRIPSASDTVALAGAILDLHLDPDERIRLGRRIAGLIGEASGTWNERIGVEIALLQRIAAGDLP